MTVFHSLVSTPHASRLACFWLLLRSRSLFWQLLLLFLLVVLVAVITMGISMNWLAQHDLENYADHNNLQKGNAQQVAARLSAAFQQHQTREQIQTLVEHLAQTSGTQILLIDQQHQVRADSLRSFLGQTFLPSESQEKQQREDQQVSRAPC